MPYSAHALGRTDLRLRLRRSRSDRSHRLSVQIAVAVVAAVGLIGLASAGIQAHSASTTDTQRYLQALWPISVDLEQSANRVGLAAALYEDADIDETELRSRLDTAIDAYTRDADQIGSLDPPPELADVHQGYVASAELLRESTQEMLKTCDDGDDAHISAAVPLMLDTTARLHGLNEQFWPARVG